jgi:hypothetical protein
MTAEHLPNHEELKQWAHDELERESTLLLSKKRRRPIQQEEEFIRPEKSPRNNEEGK